MVKVSDASKTVLKKNNAGKQVTSVIKKHHWQLDGRRQHLCNRVIYSHDCA
jgi:hypothetical protein